MKTQKSIKLLILGTLLILLVLVAGCIGGKDKANTEESAASEEVVSISLSDVSTTAQFYTYTDNGVDINYFAVLGSDGEVRTAFDACDVCGGYKGYEQRGTDIVCRNCGKVFRIDGLGTKNKGYGCWPSYLPHEIKDGNILIKDSDLQKGRSKFN